MPGLSNLRLFTGFVTIAEYYSKPIYHIIDWIFNLFVKTKVLLEQNLKISKYSLNIIFICRTFPMTV